MVERWPFKPMAVGSIPTEGAFFYSSLHIPPVLTANKATKQPTNKKIHSDTTPTQARTNSSQNYKPHLHPSAFSSKPN